MEGGSQFHWWLCGKESVSNSGDMGSVPVLRGFYMSVEQLSVGHDLLVLTLQTWVSTAEPMQQLLKPGAARPRA